MSFFPALPTLAPFQTILKKAPSKIYVRLCLCSQNPLVALYFLQHRSQVSYSDKSQPDLAHCGPSSYFSSFAPKLTLPGYFFLIVAELTISPPSSLLKYALFIRLFLTTLKFCHSLLYLPKIPYLHSLFEFFS